MVCSLLSEWCVHTSFYQRAAKLCTRTLYDESGCPHACLDEYMKSRLENKLIRAILGVN